VEGADSNEIDRLGYAPLHGASTPEIIGPLAEFGAEVNRPNRFGDTPLRGAAAGTYPDLECIKELLRQGADEDIKMQKNRYSTTPMEAVRMAIEAGIVDHGSSASTNMDDDARLEYAKLLPLFFLPQHLWPRLNFGD
jgi:hypothetical protein